MPLAQLNLKLPPAVLAQWRALAAAEGLSVRDWLLATLAPTAEPQAGPAGGADGLADRLQALEVTTAQLAATVAQLQQARPPRSPRAGEAPSPERVSAAPRTAEALAPAGALTTAELAERLGMKRGSLNERLRRAGGARVGLQLIGWRCVGQAPPPAGGPLRWLWVPAES